MKTENLTWAEAIRAYADGMRIRDKDGDDYWIDGYDMPCSTRSPLFIQTPSGTYAPFSIVQPEVKSLSFEEAIKCADVRVHLPDGNKHRATKPFIANDYAIIHVAERRGWVITEVTE